MIWLCLIAKCSLAILQQPIAKHTLAMLATSYRLNRNNRVSSFYWTRGSKLCFLTCFSDFSCYFHILVFSQKSLLTNFFVPFSAARKSDFSSRFLYHWHSELLRRTCAPCFWHRTHGFLEARRSWELGSSLTTGEFSLFRLLPKVSGANVHWTEHNSYLSYSQKILELTLSCVT